MKPLNPIMAVLAIAFVGALPLRSSAADGITPPVGRAVANDDSSPVNALANILIANPVARAEAGKRIEDFLVKPADGKSFIKADVDAVAVGAIARAWGEKEADPGQVALLYFVIGPGASTPGWAAKDPILSKSFAPGKKWPARLRLALKRWTAESQIDKTAEAEQAKAFLVDAAQLASTVFIDAREKGEIVLSAEHHDETAIPTPHTQTVDTNRLGTQREYTLKTLYEDGAIVEWVQGPNDKNPRKISMKIYTKRLPGNVVVNEIGIFDITDTSDIVGRRFPISERNKTFAIDTRTAGLRKFELEFGVADENGDRSISLKRPGGKATLTTSVTELFTKRADQVSGLAANGDVVKIAGQTFYVLPQGGATSGLLLFPRETIVNRPKNARDLIPALYADVGKRGTNGRAELTPGDKLGPHLGSVGGKEFHLEWNPALVPPAWDVKDGPGNMPTEPAPAKPAPGRPAGGPTGGPTGGPGGTPPAPTEGESTPDEIVKTLFSAAFCKRDDESHFAEELKGKFALVTCDDPEDGLKVVVLTPASIDPGQQRIYKSVTGQTITGGRLLGRYAVLEFKENVQYLDLIDDKNKTANNFAMSGSVTFSEKKNEQKADDFANVDAFSDAITTYLKIPAADLDIEAVPGRLKELVGDKPYTLSCFYDPTNVFTVRVGDEKKAPVGAIWPTVIKDPETPAGPNPWGSLSGPGTVFEGSVASVDVAFPTPLMDLPDNKKAAPVPGKTTVDSALYNGVDEPQKYFLTYKYYALDPTEKKIFRQKPFELFNETRLLPEVEVHIQGLVTAVDNAGSAEAASKAVVKSSIAVGYKLIQPATRERGVVALFQNKQVSGENQTDKAANCVGPLVWWGVGDRAAAQKVCETEKY